jgi:hypothetical protein
MATFIDGKRVITDEEFQEAYGRAEGSGFSDNCDKVNVSYNERGSQYLVTCGQYYGGEMHLCDSCEYIAHKRYPQGWRGYPGDVCRHGRYTGGSGADLMCPACEFGED